VGGERGSLERNAMRYYLAVIAYVGPPPGQTEQRLRAWFQLTERYAVQLHELNEYLDEKHRELRRRSVEPPCARLCAPSSHDANQKHHDRDDQEGVNESSHRGRSDHAQKPEDNQDDCQGLEHLLLLLP
jgi:hypothetical protein